MAGLAGSLAVMAWAERTDPTTDWYLLGGAGVAALATWLVGRISLLPAHAARRDNDVLRITSGDRTADRTLARVVEWVEGHHPQLSVGILSAAGPGELHVRAAGNLPLEFSKTCERLRGASQPWGATLARGESVLVMDTQTDPLWSEHRDLARRFRIRSCWGLPLLGADAKPIGCLLACRAMPGAPAVHELADLERASLLATLALQRELDVAGHAEAIKELHGRNTALEAARRAAEDARLASDRAALDKGVFLATMTHELRTPLTAIMGFAELLEDSSTSEADRRDHLRTVRRSGEHLLALINDLLDLSKIEAGKMTVENIETDPLEVVEETAALLRERAAAKGVAVNVRCEGRLPLVIQTDPVRLRQVLLNLVGNAIKFTDHGSVEIVISFIGPPAVPEQLLRIEVRDSGIGLTSEQIRRLFQPFAQADKSTSRRFGGTGLGLAISRRLVHLLGGDITCSSVLGQGSSFSFTVATGPIEESKVVDGRTTRLPAPPPIATIDTSERLRARILVAEDGEDSQRLLAFHLRRAGAEVTLVGDGKEVIEAALLAERPDSGERPYDLILMDMQMPGCDGVQATAELRRRGWAKPIVALTAHVLPDELNNFLLAGCDAVETKPINRQRLLAACHHWTKEGRRLRRAA